MEQPWVMDDKTTLAKVAPKVKVVRFQRWLAGEDVAEENA
jgi:translation elongation factor EF-Ts